MEEFFFEIIQNGGVNQDGGFANFFLELVVEFIKNINFTIPETW
jgi:hypothetical protein